MFAHPTKVTLLRLSVRLTSLLLLVLAALSHAAPFRDLPVQFTQPDGSQIEIVGTGDEFEAVFETREGYTVIFDHALGGYCYAAQGINGELVSTGTFIHLQDPGSSKLPKHVRATAVARQKSRTARYQRWEQGMQLESAWAKRKALARAAESPRTSDGPQLAPPAWKTTGFKVGLTLLIDFDDSPASIPRAEIVNFLNGDNYSGYGNNGSVKRYFQDTSGGLLTYTNVVTVYVRIPNSLHPKSWYNDSNADCGEQGNLLIRDALQILKSMPNYASEILPAMSAVTVDEANRVLACNVFYAGGNGGVWGYGLWPHAWSLYSVGEQELSPGGKKIWRYQITNIGSSLSLGTFCHENGHMLCDFPDLYDYDSDSSGGAGIFCLMNSGGHGNNPVQICAYLKRAAGWSTVTEITSSSVANGTLYALPGSGFNHFYKLSKPGSSTEYFLLEARHASNRDARLPGSGIAVWHIDELGDRDNQSRIPNTVHANYEATLVQADGAWHFQSKANDGDGNDLYHAGNASAGYVNEFSDSSKPAALWWDGSASGAAFHSFSAAGPIMTFQMGHANTPPQVLVQPANQTVVEGFPVTLSAGVRGSPPMQYQWYRATTPLAGANAPQFQILSARLEDAGNYHLRITNAFGSAMSSAASLTVVKAIPLGEALERMDRTWQTGGNANWVGQTTTTADGQDSAKSGGISDNSISWMETTWEGSSGILEFWWKVSSEPGYDFLTFYIDGTEVAGISGSQDWAKRTFSVPAGLHTLRWEYTKDFSQKDGQDCGWVDQVGFTYDPPSAPWISSSPQDMTYAMGDQFSLSTELRGSWPMAVQWYRNGMALTSATNPVLMVESATLEHAGDYQLFATNTLGWISSPLARLTILPPVSIGEALDQTQWTWTTGVTNRWRGQVTETHDGLDAARSAGVGHNGFTWVESIVSGPAVIDFWWKVSSEEGYDYLEASVDGITQTRISGEVNWTQGALQVQEGSHVVRWAYVKDGSVSRGLDAGWIDQVALGAAISLQEALDSPGLNYTSSGDAVWAGQGAVSHDGSDAARSGAINHLGETTLSTIVTGPCELSFWWKVSSETDYDYLDVYVDGKLVDYISGEMDWHLMQLPLGEGNHTVEWVYSKDESNAEGADAGWVDQVTRVTTLSLAEAVNAPALNFTTGGHLPWAAQTQVSKDGVAAAQSGDIQHLQESWLETSLTGPGTLHFWWQVSSEDFLDKLSLLINGAERASISGERTWEPQMFELPAGTHTVRWSYTKDGSVSAGQDAGWIDQVSYTALQTVPTISGAKIGQSGTFECSIGGGAGSVVVIEASADLATWVPVFTNTAPFVFTDSAPVTGQKAYRAVVRP